MELQEKRARVLDVLRRAVPAGEGSRLAVAFSGGVDSTLLLALAREALGAEAVLAVTARSESLAEDELAACRRIAEALGVRLVLLRTAELSREGYRRNGPDRCYHCKDELFARIDEVVRAREGVQAVAYGATACDLGDHRPGMRAAQEHGVLAPLADAGLVKQEIRALSEELGLETWDKPAHPCLASRVPYGQEVTSTKLARIERAEACLRRLGLRELRVRHHEDPAQGAPLARIEVPARALPFLVEHADGINRELRAAGFAYVTLDLEGFRSGRLNDALTPAEGERDRGLPERRLPVLSS